MTLLSYQQVADQLGVSYDTVRRRLVGEGHLTVTYITPATPRIDSDDVERLIRERRVVNGNGASATPRGTLPRRARRVSSFRTKLRADA